MKLRRTSASGSDRRTARVRDRHVIAVTASKVVHPRPDSERTRPLTQSMDSRGKSNSEGVRLGAEVGLAGGGGPGMESRRHAGLTEGSARPRANSATAFTNCAAPRPSKTRWLYVIPTATPPHLNSLKQKRQSGKEEKRRRERHVRRNAPEKPREKGGYLHHEEEVVLVHPGRGPRHEVGAGEGEWGAAEVAHVLEGARGRGLDEPHALARALDLELPGARLREAPRHGVVGDERPREALAHRARRVAAPAAAPAGEHEHEVAGEAHADEAVERRERQRAARRGLARLDERRGALRDRGRVDGAHGEWGKRK
ncbi:hypothetical protein ACMD2_15061 [Ananas comosus]|uniref:Uncharacterized protein n=1 Tax=Ananas comosus TaxID=4615 RepID=A0A199W374_ANACO|nr:hypothetical protein ACMD2_15061 [Ananas comosus]